jgi:beta-glucanase (GH16 family)/O-antigen/teichoic acid export membrane protein
LTNNQLPQTAAPRLLVVAARSVRGLRHAPTLRWLGHPSAYAVGILIVSGLSVGTTIMAPRFLGPAAFGTFTLLTSLFQYATKTDLGLSQLADRKLTVENSAETDCAANILRSRFIIGSIVLGLIVPIAMWVAWITATLPAAATGLAIAAGGAFMIANGPVTVFRATSKIWEFTTTALLLHAGLTAPRLAGLVFGGVTGCFAALALWYGALAGLLTRSATPAAASPAPLLPMLRLALPLFAFNACWEIYLSANRWISASLSSAEDLGLFAFGANLALTGIGMLATFAQVRYPKILAQIAKHSPGASSSLVEREMLLLCLVLSGGVALAIIATWPMIELVFPRFVKAAPVTRALVVSCVPLSVVASILPIVIALSRRPWADATRIFLPAFVILLGAMIWADRASGIAGQAWACTAAGLALITGLVALMCRLGILKRWAAIRVLFFQAAAVTGLTWLTIAVAPAAAETIPPPDWELSFSDEFKSLRLWGSTSSGIWEPHFPNGGRTHGNELQYYVDSRLRRDAPAIAGLAPFSVDKGGLVIRARPIPILDHKFAENLSYASGLLTTYRSFSFTYGYAEMRARIPKGKGLWPAFWLLPVDKTWPPEIDVMEALDQNTHEFYATVHTRASGKHTEVSNKVETPDLSDGYHVYAVKWTAEEIAWYFDGRRVAATSTPADMQKPMYLLVNLAVGGWAQSPDTSTVFPAEFRIDRIRVFRPPPVGAVTSGR